MKGIVISGTGSGVGKTSVTTGLMRALSESMKVQGYKVGPDFIDPMYHTLATGRPSRNLDTFMMSKGTVERLVGHTARDADICIVEGVRGLYEGLTGTGEEGSTAEMAKLLGFPVVLVVNARSLTRSAAAMVNGFRAFDPEVNVAGVILNNVTGPQHRRKLREAFAGSSDVPVLGMIERDACGGLKERRLGLCAVGSEDWDVVDGLGGLASQMDIDSVLDVCERFEREDPEPEFPYARRRSGLRAAVPLDDAYCFYYHDNLEAMRASGMDVRTFSPLAGDMLPDADFYYLGGGYPELHMDAISENRDFLEGLRNASAEGRAVMGECGGLMTMCSSVSDAAGRVFRGAGVFDAECMMTDVRHGPSYVLARGTEANPLFRGMAVRAHEFHYSDVRPRGTPVFGFDVLRGQGIDGRRDGLVLKNSVGSYMHQHALSSEDWLAGVVGAVP
ncbi:MAG: cobyrinate a,c-diamide synthase [Candidatus Methanomethylophilaceae archaeon]|nr:cobyrinate a,c-diamide synthase [Candidatus Methanomethylophilaceae archaeon]NLF33783.1 hydrogenobyrinic acid a,c-diamide synthase (glutamine-hydrolyzing) [Thermoplasmatales archaeon]